MEINRDSYLAQLIERKHNGLVKVITGLRRVGKSFLLFNLFRRHLLMSGVKASHIVEIALDQESLKVRKPGIKASDVAPEDRKNLYITFYDVLNEFLAMPNVDLYVTGSNSRMLSKDVATSFRDRGFEIRIHPLSFGEYLEATGFDRAEAFDEYLIWGGMPMAVLERNDAARAKYLKDLFSRVYLKDIRERRKMKDDIVLDRVADMLSSCVGSLTSPHGIVRTLNGQTGVRTTDKTVKKYLDYLEDSFLFSRAKRYDIKGKKYLYFPEKFYAEDLGLRNARLNFRQTEEPHLMENAIYNELIRRGYNVDVGVVEHFGKVDGKTVKRQYEIDFVVNLGLKKVYVQSAFRIPDEEKRLQETAAFRRSGDFFRKIVVTSGARRPLSDENGVVYVGVIPFLLDPALLEGES